MKEEVKEEVKKEISQLVQDNSKTVSDSNLIEEDNIEEKKDSYKKLKSFKVVKKESSTGRIYYNMEVSTFGDKVANLILSDSQAEILKVSNVTECYVDIESRYSEKARKSYDVIALHIGEDIVFDFFAKDRAFCTLAKLQAKNYFNK